MKRLSIVEFAMRYRQIVFLIVSLMVLLGIYALFVMPRQEFPSFTIRQGLVIGAYPGASSSDIEEQLTSKVESYLFSFKEINKKKTYSISKDGLMIVFVTLNDNVMNSDEFWAKLNHGLNNLKQQLPSGLLALYSDNDFGDTSALLITIESDHKTYRELEAYLDEMENRLRRIESVSKVRHYGLQKEQITVYIDKAKLTNYGISSSSLLSSLFTQGFTTSNGKIENDSYIAPIHISPSYNNEEDVADQIVYSDPSGNIIRLKDVARIVREYPDADSYITNNGHKCLLVSLEMQPGNNIVHYGKDVGEVLRQFQSELPKGVSVERIADQPKVVSDSITMFLLEMLYAIIAVILVTMVLLPFRVAAVAATSIPVSIFVSLGIMLLAGMELNTVTLAALVVVLGMIVDNSIVIVDSYMEKLDHGMSRWHAAISSAQGFFKAIFSATLAISITFFPFLFTITGMTHDFVLLFPWTVTITLGISLLVAMLFIPFLEYYFIKVGFKKLERKKNGKKRRSFLDMVQQIYEKWLVRAFKHPRVTVGVGILTVLAGIALFPLAPQRLMPIAERDQFAVEIYLPQGSSLQKTALVADSLEQILKKDKRVKSITSFIGTSSPRFHASYAPKMPAKNYAQFIVNTHSNKETEEVLSAYSTKYSNYFSNAYVRFKQLDYQEAANPIEVRFSGNNIAALKVAADSLSSQLRKVKGLTWIHTNYEEMLPGAHIDINSLDANRLGITKAIVATNLAMSFDEVPLTTLWEGDYPVVVKLKADASNKASCDDIQNEYVSSLVPGVSVPLRQIAKVEPDWTQGQIVRRNGVPTISVLGDVQRGVNVNKVFGEVKKIGDNFSSPKGAVMQYGGTYETDNESLPQLLGAMSISVFIIFFILVFHFRKINLALLVLGSSSLSLIGAVAGVLIMRSEFGVTSLLGLVSLIGILVRNGIIMLDYAEELRGKGKTVLEAAFEAGKRRMRPIFLTSAAASMGVIPMMLSGSALWSPVGTVICFGTLTSMVLLVLILPVVYWLIFRKVDKGRKDKKVLGDLLITSRVKPVALTLFVLLGLASVLHAQPNYSLEQCKSLALQNNLSVKNKMLDVEVAQQTKKAAFTKFFPQVEAMGMSFRFNKSLIDMNIPGGDLPVYDGNPANLSTATQFAYFPGMSISMLDKGTIGLVTVTQPVFAGKQITNGNKLANIGIKVDQLQLAAAQNEVVLGTEKQYWQVLALEGKMKTLKRYVEMVDTLHREVLSSYNAGLITRNDLLKVELKQNELQMNYLKLSDGIELAKMAFCQYIGVEYSPKVTFVDTIPAEDAPQLIYADHKKVIANRPEYQLLQESVKAENYQTRIQRGEYMPQVALGVGGQYLDIMDGSGSSYGMVFGTVKIPISGWWEASHKLKAQHLKEKRVQNAVTDNTEKLLLQMQQARNKLDEAYQQVLLSRVSTIQADENLKVNRDNYRSGIIAVSDLLEAQAQLQQSNDDYTEAMTNYQIARLYYLQITVQ